MSSLYRIKRARLLERRVRPRVRPKPIPQLLLPLLLLLLLLQRRTRRRRTRRKQKRQMIRKQSQRKRRRLTRNPRRRRIKKFVFCYQQSKSSLSLFLNERVATRLRQSSRADQSFGALHIFPDNVKNEKKKKKKKKKTYFGQNFWSVSSLQRWQATFSPIPVPYC